MPQAYDRSSGSRVMAAMVCLAAAAAGITPPLSDETAAAKAEHASDETRGKC